jgi:hypothetical protein
VSYEANYGGANCHKHVFNRTIASDIRSEKLVSLVQRHESNGVEPTNKKILRGVHRMAKIFVFVTIGSTIIGLIAHACDSMVHSETNYPPMERKFGSNNLPYMTLPDNEIISSSAQVLQELKTDFKVIRELSHKYQQQLVKDRDNSSSYLHSFRDFR